MSANPHQPAQPSSPEVLNIPASLLHQPVEVLPQALVALLHRPNEVLSDYAIVAPDGQHHPLPLDLLLLLAQAAYRMAEGSAVSLVATEKELTTQEAADLLQVSRQYLVRLLNAGELPCRKTGAHRRLRLRDVLQYQEVRDRRRLEGLRQLTAMSETFGGYDAEPK